MVLEWTNMKGRNPEQHGSRNTETQHKPVLSPVSTAYIFHFYTALISLNNNLARPGRGQTSQPENGCHL